MTTEPHSTEPAAATAGEWVMPDVSYVEPARRFCALCGRPLARRYWQAAPSGEPLPFCDSDHAALYAEYGGYAKDGEGL